MDTLLLKISTKSMFEMIKPLADKLKSIKTDAKSYNELLKIVDSTGLQLLHMTCINEDLLKQFSIHLNNFKCEFSKPKKSWEPNYHNSLTVDLINSMYKIMEAKENIQINRIIEAINNCQEQIIPLIKELNTKDFIGKYKNFIEDFEYTIDLHKIRAKDLLSSKQKDLIHLNISQIYKTLPLLSEYHTIYINQPLQCKEMNDYLLQRFEWCFNELLKLVKAPKPSETEEIDFAQGHFIVKMDYAFLALDNVIDLDTNDVANFININLKAIIEDVVCHALSIAQVALPTDQKAISEICQVILNNLEVLKNEIWNIWVMSTNLSKSMESLEKLINTTLLKLVSEVFSNPFNKLKALVQKCVLSRTCSDIDEEIIAFDLQMDQIMQIGLFALHCTNDKKLKLEIRSCLASLESLEPELVPALSLFAKDSRKNQHRALCDFFVSYWQKEIKNLILFIDQIIDPAAFTQVVLERTMQLTLSLKIKVLNHELTQPKILIDDITLGAKRLLAVLDYVDISPGTFQKTSSKVKLTSPLQVDHLSDNSNLTTYIQNIKQAISQCESTLDILEDHNDHEIELRLYRCCKHLLSTIKHIEPILIDSNLTDEEIAKTLREIAENRSNPDEKVLNGTYQITKINENMLTPFKELANTLVKKRQNLCYDQNVDDNTMLDPNFKLNTPFNRQNVKRKSTIFGRRIQSFLTKENEELIQEKTFYFEFSEILSQVLSLPESFSCHSIESLDIETIEDELLKENDLNDYDQDFDENKDNELSKENDLNDYDQDIDENKDNELLKENYLKDSEQNIEEIKVLYIDEDAKKKSPNISLEVSLETQNEKVYQKNSKPIHSPEIQVSFNQTYINDSVPQISSNKESNLHPSENEFIKQSRTIAVQTPIVFLNNEDVSTPILAVSQTAPPLFDLDLSRTSNAFSSLCRCTHLNSSTTSDTSKLQKLQRLGKSATQITSIIPTNSPSFSLSSSTSSDSFNNNNDVSTNISGRNITSQRNLDFQENENNFELKYLVIDEN